MNLNLEISLMWCNVQNSSWRVPSVMVRLVIQKWESAEKAPSPSTHTRGITMTTEHKTDNKRQPRQQAQKDKPHGEHPEQKAHQDKSSKGYDTMTDTRQQEKAGKGKIATSEPGGSKPDRKRA